MKTILFAILAVVSMTLSSCQPPGPKVTETYSISVEHYPGSQPAAPIVVQKQ